MGNLQVGGEWDAIQSNEFRAHFSIQQSGTQLNGGMNCSHSGGTVKSESATGYVNGNYFEFIVKWNNGTQGKYVGLQNAGGDPDRGKIVGVTVDLLHPTQHADWTSSRSFPLSG